MRCAQAHHLPAATPRGGEPPAGGSLSPHDNGIYYPLLQTVTYVCY